MKQFDFDHIVIGAGVVGLAMARQLAMRGGTVLIVEKEPLFGSHTSARNSEVIHAGIYYDPNSLKGRLCVPGREMLYEYCRSAGVPHRKIGKLIIAANEDQIVRLEQLLTNAEALGTGDLLWQSKDEVARLESALRCEAALLSPSTGIIDSHQYMLALLADAEAGGATYAPRTTVTDIEPLDDGFQVSFDVGEGENHSLSCRRLVNCAGLGAWKVAEPLYAAAGRALPARYFAKGTYYSHAGKAPFSRLVYPQPIDGGLGIHVTIDLGGCVRFGPDVEWVEEPDYLALPSRKAEFVSAIRQYFPDLCADDIEPDFAGVRPRTAPPGEDNDFLIDVLSCNGAQNSVHLFGIESPGLTSSLAIADYTTTLFSDWP